MLFFVECFLSNFLDKSLGVLYEVGVSLAVQMTVPAFGEFDTFVNSEIVPFLEDHGLLFRGAGAEYI